MKLTRVIAISVIAASLGLAANVRAQSLKNVETPNEFPPASYKGKQYVDSKGCVYIRAGVDGNITWVPRMTRDRKVVCGYKPTNPNAAPTTASAQKLDKNVVVIQPAAPETSTAAAAPQPKPKPKPKAATTSTTTTAAKPKAKPQTTTAAKPKATTTTTTAAAPATTTTTKTKTPWWAKPPTTSTTTTTAAPAPKPTTTTTTKAPTTTTTTTTAPTTTTTSNTRRTLDGTPRQSGFDAPCRGGVQGSRAVRCGPQSELPYTPGTGNPTAPPPRIIYNRQGASLSAPYAPAPGTIVREGDVASTVRVIPRHLYQNYQYALNDTTVPDGYVRVFDDGRLNPQRAVMTFEGKAATDAIWTQKVPRRVRDDAPTAVVISTKSSPAAAPAAAAPVISTKSAAPEKSLRVSGQNYVQAATYTDRAAAQSTAHKLRGLGMPVKIGKYDKNGQTYRMVLAGPFADTASADRAVTKVRRAGYSDAFVR
ncbi:SPOR domain-containing protein [Shimia sediminis]|uniref:SPOR domain-containing protein n=1 Tax=Shimia sediminis TaxID=2497945 RepID=UPI00197DD7EB|nr:SPOR domain-containing protein [Shimia sediminis]